VRHVASPSPASKYDLACMVGRAFGVTTTIVETTGPTPCDKTLSSVYPAMFVVPEISVQVSDLRKFMLLDV
jgi:hypothetical protein